LLLGASSLSGSTLFTVASMGTLGDPNESNDHTGATVSLLKTGYDPAWDTLSGAQWISFKNTVCPGCVDPNASPNFFNSTAADPFVTFTQIFTIPVGMVPVGGSLTFLADDSVVVDLNASNPARSCCVPYHGDFMEPATGPFNFQLHNGSGLTVGYSSLQQALIPGVNVLTFRVYNLGAFNVGSNGDGTGGVASFGLAYLLNLDLLPEVEAFAPGSVGSVPQSFLSTDCPEPATMALAALGLLLVAYSRYGRRTPVLNNL
jgi:PEP-CTERM motif